MTDTRTAVELAIPSMLFLVVARDTCFSCFDSLGLVTDTAGYLQLVEIRSQLDASIEEALAPLSLHQRATARRYVHKAASEALKALDGQPGAKASRALLWWLAEAIETGKIELFEGSSADQAISRLMQWTGDTFDLMPETAAERMDKSSQKNARKIWDVLKRMGYYK